MKRSFLKHFENKDRKLKLFIERFPCYYHTLSFQPDLFSGEKLFHTSLSQTVLLTVRLSTQKHWAVMGVTHLTATEIQGKTKKKINVASVMVLMSI